MHSHCQISWGSQAGLAFSSCPSMWRIGGFSSEPVSQMSVQLAAFICLDIFLASDLVPPLVIPVSSECIE